MQLYGLVVLFALEAAAAIGVLSKCTFLNAKNEPVLAFLIFFGLLSL